MKGNRKSNIEILRIISMLCIICFHYVYKSGYIVENLSINSFFIKIFWFFGEFGVNIFMLIMGYFMVHGKFSFKKLICLILEVDFYYLISMYIANKLGISKIEPSVRSYVLLFFPTIINKYWFITAYILVYIISPYLNILIKNMEERTYKKFLLTVLILWCVIPTIFGIFYNNTETLMYYSRFLWFIIMYFVGAYIRLYSKFKKSICLRNALLSFLAMILGILIIYKFRNVFDSLGTKELSYFWTPNTIPMFIFSISIFEIFLKIDVGSIKIINKIASTTLGIYIMHDGVLNPYIWQVIFKTFQHLHGNFPIIHILSASIMIFCVGLIIDLIRQFIEKITIKKFLDSNISQKISKKLENCGNKILDII